MTTDRPNGLLRLQEITPSSSRLLLLAGLLISLYRKALDLLCSSASIKLSSGVALEYLILLASEQDADPWLNIPAFATDDYVTQMANLIYDLLLQKYSAYIEYSNEVWNHLGGRCILFIISGICTE